MPNEVFLSHSSADRAFTARLADVLQRHGVPVWYSDTSIRGAQQWHDEIGAALRRCDWLALVLSPDAVATSAPALQGLLSRLLPPPGLTRAAALKRATCDQPTPYSLQSLSMAERSH